MRHHHFSPNIENKQTIFLFPVKPKCRPVTSQQLIFLCCQDFSSKLGMPSKLYAMCIYQAYHHIQNLVQILFHYSLFSCPEILQTPILFLEQPLQIRVFIQRCFVVADLAVMVKCPANAIYKNKA